MAKSFIKMQGLGNDFVIFDARAEKLEIAPARIRQLADRRLGIGFDQLIVIDKPRTSGTDIFMRIYNADSSEVGACGNATRCVGKLLMTGAELNVETRAGILTAKMIGAKVRVDMGVANTENIALSEGDLYSTIAVDVGNPHAVFFVPDVAAVPLETVGPKIEHNPLFPDRTNVEVAQVLSPDKIRMRVWERGVGITAACGTGACAVAVAGVRQGLTDRHVTVVLDGGELEIEWRESDGHVLMTGPAEEVYRGTVTL